MAISTLIFRICLFAAVHARPSSDEDSTEDLKILKNELGPFSADFKAWLAHPDRAGTGDEALKVYDKYGATGSFGGRKSKEEKITREPVIFIHGNSDSALDIGTEWGSGWTAVLNQFQSSGYKLSELYGITYGQRDLNVVLNTMMSCDILQQHRQLLENVLNYTGAAKVDIIGHSMGATIARKIVKGGLVQLQDESCDLGPNMADKVDTLIALAGAHYGMCFCASENLIAFNACNVVVGIMKFHDPDKANSKGRSKSKRNGYYPSMTCGNGKNVHCGDAKEGDCPDANYGEFLKSINQDDSKEANYVYSLWSNDDEVLGKGSMAWGRNTSLVPGSTKYKAYTKLTHFNIKERTAQDMISLVQHHTAEEMVQVRRVQRSLKSHHSHHHHKNHHKESYSAYDLVF